MWCYKSLLKNITMSWDDKVLRLFEKRNSSTIQSWSSGHDIVSAPFVITQRTYFATGIFEEAKQLHLLTFFFILIFFSPALDFSSPVLMDWNLPR